MHPGSIVENEKSKIVYVPAFDVQEQEEN